MRERRIVVACGQASRVGNAMEGRGHTLYCDSASLQPEDGLLGAHGLNPRELCGDGRQERTGNRHCICGLCSAIAGVPVPAFSRVRQYLPGIKEIDETSCV